MTPHLAALGLALLAAAYLAACLARSRIREALYRAERDAARAALDRERATTEAARVLYGEARMREAAARVEMRERDD